MYNLQVCVNLHFQLQITHWMNCKAHSLPHLRIHYLTQTPSVSQSTGLTQNNRTHMGGLQLYKFYFLGSPCNCSCPCQFPCPCPFPFPSPPHSFAHLLINTLTLSLPHPFTTAFSYNFTHLLPCSFTSLIHYFTHPWPYTYSLPHSFITPLIHHPTHSPAHSFTTSLIHYLTHPPPNSSTT